MDPLESMCGIENLIEGSLTTEYIYRAISILPGLKGYILGSQDEINNSPWLDKLKETITNDVIGFSFDEPMRKILKHYDSAKNVLNNFYKLTKILNGVLSVENGDQIELFIKLYPPNKSFSIESDKADVINAIDGINLLMTTLQEASLLIIKAIDMMEKILKDFAVLKFERPT